MTTSMQRSMERVGIVGVPFNKGQPLDGVALGPQAIRDGGLVEDLKEFNQWIDIQDYGDVNEHSAKITNTQTMPTNMRNYEIFAGTMQRLSDKVLEVYRDNRMCWTLGGDHAIAVGETEVQLMSTSTNAKMIETYFIVSHPLGSISGHLRHNENTSVIWIDAHSDLNTNRTSQSGNIHGMPVALLAQELDAYWGHLTGLEWLKNK